MGILKRLQVLLLVTALIIFLAAFGTAKPQHPHGRYYLSARCLLDGVEIHVFGATNLPPGSKIYVGVQDFIGSYSHTLAEPMSVAVGKDGLFKIDVEAKKGAEFKPNQICSLGFMPTDPEQPASVLKIVGRVGEHLGDPSKNPQIGGNVRVKTLEATTVVLD